jgi:hypothetical protein
MGEIIKMDVNEVECEGKGMDWTDMSQGGDKWRVLVRAVINLRFL